MGGLFPKMRSSLLKPKTEIKKLCVGDSKRKVGLEIREAPNAMHKLQALQLV